MRTNSKQNLSHLKSPLALFDDIKHIKDPQALSTLTDAQTLDYNKTLSFLQSYTGSTGTFNAYRREVERLLQWAWKVANKTIKELQRDDIEAFIHFCQKPLKAWIGLKKAPRFIEQEGKRLPNPEWRPFVVAVSKTAHRNGEAPNLKDFKFSMGGIKETFAILSSFYNFLLQDDYASTNPVALIRQKSKFIRKTQGPQKIRRLSELQWQTVIKSTQEMAEKNPVLHERTLFMISTLYALYLRISELAANTRWAPSMQHFHRDHDGNWWFTTVGKGNKQRQIAVSNAMLNALKRWRKHLGLSPLPSPADHSPLLPKIRGQGPISDINHIREIVQSCFNQAIDQLKKDNFGEEAESLSEATVHWLRHTGISEDVKHRPREHVRDDAGHSSSATTDKYIDIELRARHKSAKNKLISSD